MINKEELEKWVKNCNTSGCKHKEPASLDNLVCEKCKEETATYCGHEHGTRYACLRCGTQWEFAK